MNINDRHPCPFCKSSKVMFEGGAKRLAIVCQKCLARGPEVDIGQDLDRARAIALYAWNYRTGGKRSRVICPDCKRLVAVSGCGLWTHYGAVFGIRCPGSGKSLSAIDTPAKMSDGTAPR